jgi:hypothetical protein
MGINDGLVSTASLMLGVGAGSEGLRAMQVCCTSAHRCVAFFVPCNLISITTTICGAALDPQGGKHAVVIMHQQQQVNKLGR